MNRQISNEKSLAFIGSAEDKSPTVYQPSSSILKPILELNSSKPWALFPVTNPAARRHRSADRIQRREGFPIGLPHR
jgi:hypothetical protein